MERMERSCLDLCILRYFLLQRERHFFNDKDFSGPPRVSKPTAAVQCRLFAGKKDSTKDKGSVSRTALCSRISPSWNLAPEFAGQLLFPARFRVRLLLKGKQNILILQKKLFHSLEVAFVCLFLLPFSGLAFRYVHDAMLNCAEAR